MHRLVPVALSQLVGVLMGMVGIKLVTHWIPVPVYGVYTLFVTLTQLGSLLTHSGLTNHASRYWHRERGQGGTFVRFLWTMSWRQVWPLGCGLAVLTLAFLVYRKEPIWGLVWPLLLVGNVAVAFGNVANNVLNAQEKHWWVLLLNTLNALRSLFPVLVAGAVGASFWMLSLGFTIHSLAVLTAIALIFRWAWDAPPVAVERQGRWAQELRNYGRPFVLMGVGGWLLQNADRWVVACFFGEARAGLFGTASQIGAIVPNLAAAGLMQLFFPRIFRQADAATTMCDWKTLARFCDQLTLLLLGLSLGGLGVLSWMGPHLVGWLIGLKYQAAMAILLPAGLAMLTVQANQFQYLLLQGQHNSADMVKAMIVVALVKTGGSVLAAAIDWSLFLYWLTGSSLVCAVLGRYLIQREALRSGPGGEAAKRLRPPGSTD